MADPTRRDALRLCGAVVVVDEFCPIPTLITSRPVALGYDVEVRIAGAVIRSENLGAWPNRMPIDFMVTGPYPHREP